MTCAYVNYFVRLINKIRLSLPIVHLQHAVAALALFQVFFSNDIILSITRATGCWYRRCKAGNAPKPKYKHCDQANSPLPKAGTRCN